MTTVICAPQRMRRSMATVEGGVTEYLAGIKEALLTPREDRYGGPCCILPDLKEARIVVLGLAFEAVACQHCRMVTATGGYLGTLLLSTLAPLWKGELYVEFIQHD